MHQLDDFKSRCRSHQISICCLLSGCHPAPGPKIGIGAPKSAVLSLENVCCQKKKIDSMDPPKAQRTNSMISVCERVGSGALFLLRTQILRETCARTHSYQQHQQHPAHFFTPVRVSTVGNGGETLLLTAKVEQGEPRCQDLYPPSLQSNSIRNSIDIHKNHLKYFF